VVQQTARLSEVARSITDGDHQAPPKSGQGIPFLTISAINDGSLSVDKATRYVPESYYSNLKQERKPELGDILFSVTGSIAIPAIVDDPRPFTFQRHIAIIKPDPTIIDSRYLLHTLRTDEIKEQALSVATGTAQLTIPLGGLRNFEIPLPPLAEQRRIVAKLDSLRARSARARHQLDLVPKLIERYKQAILAKAFSGGLTKEHASSTEFVEKPLSTAIQSTFYGPRFSRDAYEVGGTITLRTTDFDDHGNVCPRDPPAVSVTQTEYAKWGLIDGDLLITQTGSIGKCAIYERSVGPALPSAYLIRVRLNLELIRPRFALQFLLSARGKDQLLGGVTAVTQPNINASVIERLMLPLPEIETQDCVINEIDIALSWLDKIASEQARAQHLLPKLNQAILAKAFRGELVPQDPNDEPAYALLSGSRQNESTTIR
jgi:type I restriction enzyme S subunit